MDELSEFAKGLEKANPARQGPPDEVPPKDPGKGHGGPPEERPRPRTPRSHGV